MLGQSVGVSDGFDERPLDVGQPSSPTVRLLANSQLCSLRGFLRRVLSSTHLSKVSRLNRMSIASRGPYWIRSLRRAPGDVSALHPPVREAEETGHLLLRLYLPREQRTIGMLSIGQVETSVVACATL